MTCDLSRHCTDYGGGEFAFSTATKNPGKWRLFYYIPVKMSAPFIPQRCFRMLANQSLGIMTRFTLPGGGASRAVKTIDHFIVISLKVNPGDWRWKEAPWWDDFITWKVKFSSPEQQDTRPTRPTRPTHAIINLVTQVTHVCRGERGWGLTPTWRTYVLIG